MNDDNRNNKCLICNGLGKRKIWSYRTLPSSFTTETCWHCDGSGKDIPLSKNFNYILTIKM